MSENRHAIDPEALSDLSRAEFATGPTPPRSTWRAWLGALAMLMALPLLAMVVRWWAPINRFPSEVLDALEQDSNTIFYSMNNSSSGRPTQGPPAAEVADDKFRGYGILGKVVLASADERKSLRRGLVSATFNGWDSAACFDPRHGFRVTGSSGTFEVVLCLECGLAHVYYPDGKLKYVYLGAKLEALNQILTNHGVAVAP